ncbi:acyl-CoA reductase [Asticcacaulis sp. DXS10W]|uniref:Acyl-CoA reductase n=1 Tax=Asticcacaulis currens TaxID=2984210 RepID=A0ABT5I9G6_9CAUL|nr:acyl-CoA reductase [Asticcacaulis currens]MDC7692826.1 acyl-CoA reductase [Asticcacaulis currens]
MNSKTSSDVTVVCPLGANLEQVYTQRAWSPFRAEAINFVQDLSGSILRSSRFRRYPELLAFAHEMRKKRLLDLVESIKPATHNGVLRGRGIAVHFAPANVDTIFLYSLLLSLLAGNANIVRVSNKPSEQVGVIIDAINALLSEPRHALVRERIALVRYSHDEEITRRLSSQADLRIIWGGDKTVNLIRSLPINPLSRDITFPDRWSLAVFDANFYLTGSEQNEVARQFANDSFWFAQMACSSPRLIIWRGREDERQEASRIFYENLRIESHRHANFLSSIDFMNKRVFEDQTAISTNVNIRSMADNFVSVLHTTLSRMPDLANHCGAGLFIDAAVTELSELTAILDRKAQTVVSYGVSREDWSMFLTSGTGTWGIDRIVQPGEALSFGPIWDGMSLIREFTRETVIQV